MILLWTRTPQLKLFEILFPALGGLRRITVGKRKTSNHEAEVFVDLASLRREDQVEAKKLTSEMGILCISCTLSLLN
jgi:hypothetical protein